MYEYNVTLDRVVDADTVDVIIDLGFDVRLWARLRLFGINAPETRTKDLEEKARGLAAKDRLIELLPQTFRIQSEEYDRGKYGRILATIFIPDETSGVMNVNEQLIQEGHAVRYMT